MEGLLLGIDIGTSACKIAVFDKAGQVVSQANKPYKVYYPKNGYVEQNPNEWWEAIVDGIKEVLSRDDIDAKDIKGIGVDGQSWSSIPVDRDGNVLANTPIWMDTRARYLCDRVIKDIGEDEIFEVSGNNFLPNYSTPKMLWFKENHPEIFNKTYKFLQSNSYIVYKLTGNMTQDMSQGYGLHFFNCRKLEYDSELAEKLGLSVDLVPGLCRCDEIVGHVTEKVSKITGLSEGTPVVAGGLDAACGALGAGVYKAGQTQEQGGQAGGMSICTNEALAHRNLILSSHVVPDMWLLQGGSVGGGGALKWFKQEFGQDETFDDLTKEAEKIPAGSDGVVFLPYMSGERSPIWDPDAKGVFYGLSFDKTKAHMIRAVLEGVAFSLEHNMRVAKETGVKVGGLNAMGGAANSTLWTQIKSDVTGLPIDVPASDTATTLGAVILAGIGCGMYQSYDEAIETTIKITKSYKPNMENHKTYINSMELYLELYNDLKDTYKRF